MVVTWTYLSTRVVIITLNYGFSSQLKKMLTLQIAYCRGIRPISRLWYMKLSLTQRDVATIASLSSSEASRLPVTIKRKGVSVKLVTSSAGHDVCFTYKNHRDHQAIVPISMWNELIQLSQDLVHNYKYVHPYYVPSPGNSSKYPRRFGKRLLLQKITPTVPPLPLTPLLLLM